MITSLTGTSFIGNSILNWF